MINECNEYQIFASTPDANENFHTTETQSRANCETVCCLTGAFGFMGMAARAIGHFMCKMSILKKLNQIALDQ